MKDAVFSVQEDTGSVTGGCLYYCVLDYIILSVTRASRNLVSLECNVIGA